MRGRRGTLRLDAATPHCAFSLGARPARCLRPICPWGARARVGVRARVWARACARAPQARWPTSGRRAPFPSGTGGGGEQPLVTRACGARHLPLCRQRGGRGRAGPRAEELVRPGRYPPPCRRRTARSAAGPTHSPPPGRGRPGWAVTPYPSPPSPPSRGRIFGSSPAEAFLSNRPKIQVIRRIGLRDLVGISIAARPQLREPLRPPPQPLSGAEPWTPVGPARPWRQPTAGTSPAWHQRRVPPFVESLARSAGISP